MEKKRGAEGGDVKDKLEMKEKEGRYAGRRGGGGRRGGSGGGGKRMQFVRFDEVEKEFNFPWRPRLAGKSVRMREMNDGEADGLTTREPKRRNQGLVSDRSLEEEEWPPFCLFCSCHSSFCCQYFSFRLTVFFISQEETERENNNISKRGPQTAASL